MGRKDLTPNTDLHGPDGDRGSNFKRLAPGSFRSHFNKTNLIFTRNLAKLSLASMKTQNIHEAKTNLSKLLELVEQGEEVVIARAGKPVAKLVPFHPRSRPRKPGGRWKGRIKIAKDFDQLPDDLIRMFYGENN
jgi:prevent-host-death family protein